jgi:hypothetical protein
LLGFSALPKADMKGDLKHRIERVASGRTPTKSAWTSTVSVLDSKEVELKQMEKNIVCKAVPMAAKWTGNMENGTDTTLEEDFLVMAFGDFLSRNSKCPQVDGLTFQLEEIISRPIFTSIRT